MKNSLSSIAVTFLLPVLIFPLLTAFVYDDEQAQRQRRRGAVPPQELYTLPDLQGMALQIDFQKGSAHNHPLMAFWVEDTAGNYLHALYVAESIARGYFRHGDAASGRWQPGALRRPAALPYWGHQRGVKAEDGYYIPTQDNPLPDAITGPTPKAGFVLHTHVREDVPRVFRVMMEINQSWNWNHYWHNNRFPGDENYMTSSQPALVYAVTIDADDLQEHYIMQPIGHSQWSGASGELFEDLSTLTTALDIAGEVKVSVVERPD